MSATQKPKAVSWKELVACKSACSFHRKPEVQETYERAKKRTAQTYVSYEDAIRIRYLKYGSESVNVVEATDVGAKANAKRKRAVRKEGSLPFAVVENKFPYDMAKGIGHYILWSEWALSEAEVERILVFHPVFHKKKIVHFVNPVGRQSVPDLWHCHVFVKGG